MSIIIAVDVGGTQIRVASFRRGDTEPISINKIATRGEGEIIDRICSTIQKSWPENETVEKIVIALPGPLNPSQGVIFSAPNIPEWHNYSIGSEIQNRFGTPTLIGNDANLAAMGEWKFGAGQGHQNLLYMTISTGIGGGIISDGQLVVGANGLAGEVGHIIVEQDGPTCSCGGKGHLECFTSGPFIAKYALSELKKGRTSSLQAINDFNAKHISEEALKGDALSLEAISRAGKYLGYAITSFVHLFNPSIIILGGGVSQSGELLFAPIWDALNKQVMNTTYLKDLMITKASLGDNAGMLGALALGLLPDQ